MLARLGEVLYWGGIVIACFAIATGAFLGLAMVSQGDQIVVGALGVVAAFIAYLIGRACLYVLAGR